MSIDIEKLRRLHAATTSGEWEAHHGLIYAPIQDDEDDDSLLIADVHPDRTWLAEATPQDHANARFITEIHNQLPALLDCVERLHAALKVVSLDPQIVRWLQENDPKALAQARAALGEIT